MDKQPIINIGCLGSVSDGKSTLIEKLTDIKTQRHSSEKIRNITIKQGYGNMKIWENNGNLYTTNSNSKSLDKLVNHISFVDCPGHHELIYTMLSSISLMDGAIIVIAVDQPIDNKPQLLQHLLAAKIGKIKNIIICMNKIDLISKNLLYTRKIELDNLLKQYDIKPFIIIPTCFNKKIGIDYVISAIMQLFNPSKYIDKISEQPIFRISRTFDINKPGTKWNDVKGGVIGGSVIKGTFKIGDIIEIKPSNYKTKILGIKTDTIELEEAISGGLVALLTDIDPYYCKNDALIGNICGLENTLLENTNNIKVLLEKDIIENNNFKLQIGTKLIDSKLIQKNNLEYIFELSKPISPILNELVIICCNDINKNLKIIDNGIIII
jgi:translation initiation factor 2 subunit 3